MLKSVLHRLHELSIRTTEQNRAYNFREQEPGIKIIGGC